MTDRAEYNLEQDDVRFSADLPLKIIRRSPQIPCPLHSHSFSELVVILSGTGEHRFGGESRLLAPGDVLLLHPGQVHGFERPGNLHLVNLIFDAGSLKKAVEGLSAPGQFYSLFAPSAANETLTVFRLNPYQTAQAAQCVDRIEEELRHLSDSSGRLMAGILFLYMTGQLLRRHSVSPGPRRPSRVFRALEYLERHWNERVSLADLCALTGLSAATLNRDFLQAAGLPPLVWQRHLRIRSACRLLKTTGLSVTEIAGRCGFNDANYFSRQFRRVTGCSPGAYRRQLL